MNFIVERIAHTFPIVQTLSPKGQKALGRAFKFRQVLPSWTSGTEGLRHHLASTPIFRNPPIEFQVGGDYNDIETSLGEA